MGKWERERGGKRDRAESVDSRFGRHLFVESPIAISTLEHDLRCRQNRRTPIKIRLVFNSICPLINRHKFHFFQYRDSFQHISVCDFPALSSPSPPRRPFSFHHSSLTNFPRRHRQFSSSSLTNLDYGIKAFECILSI